MSHTDSNFPETITRELVGALKTLANLPQQQQPKDEFAAVDNLPPELRDILEHEMHVAQTAQYRDMARGLAYKLLELNGTADALKKRLIQQIRDNRAAERRLLAQLRQVETGVDLAKTKSNYLPLLLAIAPSVGNFLNEDERAALDKMVAQTPATPAAKKKVSPVATPLRQRTRAG